MTQIVIPNINLEPEIEQWENAYCGKDVRQANVEAFEKIQESVNAAIQGVGQVANNQQEVVDSANTTLQAAQAAQQSAEQSAESAEEDAQAAESSAGLAANSAQQAQNEADRASMYANFVEPDFILQDNRLYISDDSTVDFGVYDNKLWIKLPA